MHHTQGRTCGLNQRERLLGRPALGEGVGGISARRGVGGRGDDRDLRHPEPGQRQGHGGGVLRPGLVGVWPDHDPALGERAPVALAGRV